MDFLVNVLQLNTSTVPIWVLCLFAGICIHVAIKYRLRQCELRRELMQLKLFTHFLFRLSSVYKIQVHSQNEVYVWIDNQRYTVMLDCSLPGRRFFKPTIDPMNTPLVKNIRQILHELHVMDNDIHYYHGAEFYNRDVIYATIYPGIIGHLIHHKDRVDSYRLAIRVDKQV